MLNYLTYTFTPRAERHGPAGVLRRRAGPAHRLRGAVHRPDGRRDVQAAAVGDLPPGAALRLQRRVAPVRGQARPVHRHRRPDPGQQRGTGDKPRPTRTEVQKEKCAEMPGPCVPEPLPRGVGAGRQGAVDRSTRQERSTAPCRPCWVRRTLLAMADSGCMRCFFRPTFLRPFPVRRPAMSSAP